MYMRKGWKPPLSWTQLTSTRGETTLVRKFIMRRITELNKITSQVVNDDTELEKVKSLQMGTVPRVEKAIQELETALQQ